MSHVCGGFTRQGREVTPEEEQILESVKHDVETSLGRHFGVFRGVSFITQVVAGTNYLFKVEVDNGEYLHAKVHKPLPHTGNPPHLMNVSGGHTLEAALNSH